MLPSSGRLRKSADFAAVLSGGKRARTAQLAVHLRVLSCDRPPRVGLVVSKKVGNSVVRHRVSRRLREQIRPLLATVSPGTDIVVRAFPSAAAASSAQLSTDLVSALRRCTAR